MVDVPGETRQQLYLVVETYTAAIYLVVETHTVAIIPCGGDPHGGNDTLWRRPTRRQQYLVVETYPEAIIPCGGDPPGGNNTLWWR